MTLNRILLVALAAMVFHVDAGLVPVDLKSEGMTDPLAVSPVPRLSWRVESEERSQVQSAYRILVASKLDLLEKDASQ